MKDFHITEEEQTRRKVAEQRVSRLNAEIEELQKIPSKPNDTALRLKHAELAVAERELEEAEELIEWKEKKKAHVRRNSILLRRVASVFLILALVMFVVSGGQDNARPWQIAAAVFGALAVLLYFCDPYRNEKI